MAILSLLLPVLVGCGEDPPVPNPPPEVRLDPIAPPIAGTQLLIASVTDDDPVGSLSVSWSLDGEAVCPASTVSEDSISSCELTIPAGTHRIDVMVTDAAGQTGAVSLTVDLAPDDPPTVELLTPTTDIPLYADAPIQFLAKVYDGQDSGSNITLAWESSLDGPLADLTDQSPSPGPDGTVTGEAFLSSGTNVLSLTATDSDGLVGTASVDLSVSSANTAPTCSLLAPAMVVEGEAPVIFVTASDTELDNGLLEVSVVSDKDGVLLEAFGELTFEPVLSGGTHTLTLTVTDDRDASCQETATVVVARPPSAMIIDPWGQVVGESQSTLFSAQVSDPDEPAEQLQLRWTSDWDGELNTTSATFIYDGLSRNDHLITLEATDSTGLTSTATATVSVNGRPSQPSISVSPAAPTVEDDLSVIIDVDSFDAEADPITYTYAWFTDGLLSTTSNGSTMPASGTTKKGEHWRVVVTPTDGITTGPAAEAELTILNAPPVATGTQILPSPANGSEPVSCTVLETFDPDGDTAFTYTTAWTIEGVDAGEAPSLSPDQFNPGDTISCTVTPNDGFDEGTPAEASTVVNYPPTLTQARLTPATPSTLDDLSCVGQGSDDLDDDEVTVEYTWRIDGLDVVEESNTLPASSTVRGSVVSCIATPWDGIEYGAPETSPSRTVVNTPPEQVSVDIGPQPLPFSGDATCVPESVNDVDGDTEFSHTYAWRVNGIPVGDDSEVLASEHFDAGDTVRCTATPDDGYDTGTGASISVVANRPPVIGSLTISPAIAGTNDTVTCVAADVSDPEEQPVTLAYTWLVNGSEIGVTDDWLAPDEFVEGDIVLCRATANDGLDSGTATNSSPILIDNSAPVLESVSLEPDPASIRRDLVCTPGVVTDSDGDTSFSFAYAWSVNEVLQPENTSTLSFANFAAGNTVQCTVTPRDNQDDGLPVTAEIVVNTPPVLDGVSLSSSAPYTDQSLTCSVIGAFDANGQEVSLSYQWMINDAPAGTGETLDSDAFKRDDEIRCVVTPEDGVDSGVAYESDTISVQNTLPVLASLSIGPTPLPTTEDVVCTPGIVTDLDDDETTVEYSWTVDGQPVLGTTGVLSASTFGSAAVITCNVTPTDGALGETLSATIIANALPEVDDVVLSPDPAFTNSNLACTAVDPNDNDGDDVTVSYAWYIGPTSAGEGGILTSNNFERDDVITCTVTLSDALDTVEITRELTIQNTPPILTSAELYPAPLSASSPVTCSPGEPTDTDGDTAFTYRYSWHVNDVEQATVTSTLSAGYAAGDTITCTVFPDDGRDEGQAAEETLVVNTPPTVASVTLTPTSATVNNYLTCTGTDIKDIDGQVVTPQYSWQVNNTWIGATNELLAPTNFSAGDTVRCRITPTDQIDDGTAVVSNAVQVASGLTRTPSGPRLLDLTAALFEEVERDTGELRPLHNGRAQLDFVITEVETAHPVRVRIGGREIPDAWIREGRALPVLHGEALVVEGSPDLVISWSLQD